MVELKTAEHVIHFMISGVISLSRYDEKFITNLQTLKQVTTNQVELFYKLIYKYRRQLSKHGYDADNLIHLPWVMSVIESSEAYTDGHVAIVDNIITFKCPYNRAFIDTFRKQPMNHFQWNRDNRQYECKFGTHALKILLETASRIYKKVHCCELTVKMIDSLKQYEDVKYWQPTLLKVNGNFIIAASNHHLDEAINDLTLNDDPVTLSRLAFYGVKIDPSVHDNSDRMNFIANMHYTMEMTDVINIVPWLKEIGCDCVYMSGPSIINHNRQQLTAALRTERIVCIDSTNQFNRTPSTTQYNFPVLLRFKKSLDSSFDPYKVGKIIQLVNSQPINIK